ncbi:MAG: acyltransferase [Desulfovibrionaceae bacterium]|nr:acyltransferase [Desulfovibrionaceae bacterium]
MPRLRLLWAKAHALGFTLPNIISYLSIKGMEHFGRFWGTLCLYLKARLLGVSLGQGVKAHGAVGLCRYPGGTIKIGDDVSIISSWRRATAQTLYAPTRLRVFGPKAVIDIGQACEMSGASITARSTTIKLGRGCLLGPNCVITDSDFHAPWPCEMRSISPGFELDQGVELEDYVWVGMQSIILKGVHIGRGAIIGARSVVTRDIPSYSVACGAPARVIRRVEP